MLASWLDIRTANVCINGEQSQLFSMSNMVFQGTVLGPLLWNLLFADAQLLSSSRNFDAIVYDDDLNTFKSFVKEEDDQHIMEELDEMQSSLHSWGDNNFVHFDPTKNQSTSFLDKSLLSKTSAC